MGLSNTLATLPGIISPLLTAAIVKNEDSSADWQIVFYLAACIYAVGAVMYGLMASGDVQGWALGSGAYIGGLGAPDIH